MESVISFSWSGVSVAASSRSDGSSVRMSEFNGCFGAMGKRGSGMYW